MEKEEDFIKGFNQGYALSKLAPEIAEQISKMEIKSEKKDLFEGFKEGRKQFITEEKDRGKKRPYDRPLNVNTNKNFAPNKDHKPSKDKDERGLDREP